MKLRNTYICDKVTYGSAGYKWAFKWPGNTVMVDCLGRKQADKVARIVNGSLKRGGKLDNLARANISAVLNKE